MPKKHPVADARQCAHLERHCLNPYELIRKYRCDSCGAVMMCACEEALARRFLAHQIEEGTDLSTRETVPVTLGFQPKICAECRDLPAEAFPVGEIHGRTSKIKRYYWRELSFEEKRRFGNWVDAHPDASSEERVATKAMIEAEVLADIKALHATSPKYVFSEPSQAQILERNAVDIVALTADYTASPQKGLCIVHNGVVVSCEGFVARYYEAQGWSAIALESRPFHALFGVMMWLLIQDPSDPKNRMVGFGDRTVYESGQHPPVIWTLLPEDFGSEGYGVRRKRAIEKHFKYLPPERGELLWVFDYWRLPSSNLRQYLWAHRDEDVGRARQLIEILSPQKILSILRYLVDNYWDHHLGWPDLFIHRGEELHFIEVKSSSDRLSQDQKRWIEDNHDRLGFPFKLVKIRRASPKGRQ